MAAEDLLMDQMDTGQDVGAVGEKLLEHLSVRYCDTLCACNLCVCGKLIFWLFRQQKGGLHRWMRICGCWRRSWASWGALWRRARLTASVPKSVCVGE